LNKFAELFFDLAFTNRYAENQVERG